MIYCVVYCINTPVQQVRSSGGGEGTAYSCLFGLQGCLSGEEVGPAYLGLVGLIV